MRIQVRDPAVTDKLNRIVYPGSIQEAFYDFLKANYRKRSASVDYDPWVM